MSTAEYQRRWREAHGFRVGQIGRPVSAPCGTVSAFKRHVRKGEPVDVACREAYNADRRRRYRQRTQIDLVARLEAEVAARPPAEVLELIARINDGTVAVTTTHNEETS